MIVDDLRVDVDDSSGGPDHGRLSARVRWSDREARIGVTAPVGALVAGSLAEGDASPFVPLTLLPAMLAGEDLIVDGPVSPVLAFRAAQAAIAYATWDHTLSPAAVEPSELVEPPVRPGAGHALYFSLGVDSLYSAALDRGPLRPLSHLVHVRDFPPRFGPEVIAGRLELIRRAADALKLPLMEVDCNAEDLTAGRGNWGDAHGGALAGVGLALAGAFDEIRIATTDSFASLVPYGSHPALDPLFSTAATSIHHDELTRSRTGKLALLARDRPDLLEHLVVCFVEERVDNCGRCGKCLLTMTGLLAAGALERATLFPDEIDLEALAALRPGPLQSRLHFLDAARHLSDQGREGQVRQAVLDLLRRSARPPWRERARMAIEHRQGRRPHPHPAWTEPTRGFDTRFHATTLEILFSGRPWPALDDAVERRGSPTGAGRLRPR